MSVETLTPSEDASPPVDVPRVAEHSRILSALAYPLLIVGWLLVVVLFRNDRFTMFHAGQALRLTAVAIMGPIVWAAAAWLSLFIELAGPLFAASSFGLLMALYLAIVYALIVGIVNALRGKDAPVPFFGTLWSKE